MKITLTQSHTSSISLFILSYNLTKNQLQTLQKRKLKIKEKAKNDH